MLDAFIIDELRRREREREDANARPRLELPVHYESEGSLDDIEDAEEVPPEKDSTIKINFQ